jgi:RNA polymerase subunit RPABC4/transcription elongation factor Spt4
MPTYKHPCPHCGKFIERDVAACPFCGTSDPFAPARCANCHAIIEDAAWVSCPRCGQSLRPATPTGAVPAQLPTPSAPPPVTAELETPAGEAATRRCAGCGAPLSAGARFCTICGTLVA